MDACDTSSANATCKEFVNGRGGKIVLAVAIKSAREYQISKGQSKGKKMCFLTLEDSTCELDNAIAFPEEWSSYKHILFEGNTVIIIGERSKKKDSFIVQKVSQI